LIIDLFVLTCKIRMPSNWEMSVTYVTVYCCLCPKKNYEGEG